MYVQTTEKSARSPLPTKVPPAGSIPTATYRLQFSGRFTLAQAERLVDYLHQLGISHCYASPLFRARPKSSHGYDVVDPTTLNPELGGEATFLRLAKALQRRGMGLIMDVVPNHMAVASPHNRWWTDVLEFGPASPYASFFDVDWHARNDSLENRVLLPVLRDSLERELASGRLRLALRRGNFVVRYPGMRFPLTPHSWTPILQAIARELEAAGQAPDAAYLLQTLADRFAAEAKPPAAGMDAGIVRQLRRDTARQLRHLMRTDAEVRAAVGRVLERLNTEARERPETSRLRQMLEKQAYCLAFWQDAHHSLNYRRFFDINDFAGLRMEEPRAFHAVHQRVLDLLHKGSASGLRIDHVDGLADPTAYLKQLRRACEHAAGRRAGMAAGHRVYIVVEKILARDEPLPEDWPIEGTTGYGFLSYLNDLFIDRRGARELHRIYSTFTDQSEPYRTMLLESRRYVLRRVLISEVQALVHLLEDIPAMRERNAGGPERVLIELIANLHVYRTYIRCGRPVRERDAAEIRRAAGAARDNLPPSLHPLLNAITGVLLEASAEPENCRFIRRFQQVCSAAAAKGEEDMAFYRWYPVSSQNEVGGRPDSLGVTTVRFHRQNIDRLRRQPATLSTTSTHDTKRSEDVRARINVLTEFPGEWKAALARWSAVNARFRVPLDGRVAPDANEEYLFYQTLFGIWPMASAIASVDWSSLRDRMAAYMEKALREARRNTSWLEPDFDYERIVRCFTESVLDPERNAAFLSDFDRFERSLRGFGIRNALSQLVLKITSPGVPDFYQGTELWQLHLVDPDNRQPVDWSARLRAWRSLQEPAASERERVRELLAHAEDGRIKMYVTARLLTLRREHPELFHAGSYVPLRVTGTRRAHILAFARVHEDKRIIAIAGRHFGRLSGGMEHSKDLSLPAALWQDTAIVLPPNLRGHYRNVLTGTEVSAQFDALQVAPALDGLPATVLM